MNEQPLNPVLQAGIQMPTSAQYTLCVAVQLEVVSEQHAQHSKGYDHVNVRVPEGTEIPTISHYSVF